MAMNNSHGPLGQVAHGPLGKEIYQKQVKISWFVVKKPSYICSVLS